MARSKEFDIDTVLRKAMHLFWSQGYEKTSMKDLVETMGVHKRSMYDTFGDKHALFMKAMEHYNESVGASLDARIQDQTSVKQAIRSIFEMAISVGDVRPPGCLVVNTACELALLDPEAAAKVNEHFAKTESLLCELITHGQDTGEISGQYDAVKLSQYLFNSLTGLRVLVKTTNDKQKLESIIDMTLAILD
ncbi:transcriptional regulator, TetR family [Paenibacillus sophorae]|uniref:TetR/AcrR family transcriptional regulator n=1 Tax=Paenibacillus sophorae TaxID=1333845 RepID=A0A1H8U2R8_9BACL|nr:TetR/AcrR family transcriptional regulator [Paenibacillus sophorae]QWU17924.1 TetR/AcrR family transcriptional regulator [Paenibacillus sophorae]SEO97549.1 transcriptional regulator, TetR family [Paenibacillus sophorae]